MALVQLDTGSDVWLTELESCEKLCREIIEQLNNRDAYQRNSDKFSAISAVIRLRLKQYNNEVDHLKTSLLYSNRLTLEEKERRQRLVEDLESKHVQMTQQFRMSKQQRDRNILFDSPANEEADSWLEDSDSDRPLLGSDFVPSVDTLREDQKSVIAEQDRGLENLSKILSRQKDIAITIGNEVDLHNDLLDDISTRMESTNSNINRETVHVRVITEKDSVFGYWLIIIALFLVILFLVLF